MDADVELLVHQAQSFSAFTGVTKPGPRDRIFPVVGMTGAGKSTFIGRCTGNDDVVVGHGLDSCTKAIRVVDFESQGRRIYLVDTPGFNDTHRSDSETLEVLASHLGASYANGVRIHGIILLHPISENRMTGSSVRNIEMLKALCGFSSYNNLAIATTMWPNPSNDTERALAESREAELSRTSRFFGELVDRGATLFRHNEGGRRDLAREAASAKNIVAHLVRQSDKRPADVLRIQREMIDEGKALGQTTAGIATARELYQMRQEHERQLRAFQVEMKSELAKADAEHAAQVRELRDDVAKKLAVAEEKERSLKRTMKDLHRDEQKYWRDKIRDLDRQLRDQLEAKEEQLAAMEDSIDQMRRDRERQRARRSYQRRLTWAKSDEDDDTVAVDYEDEERSVIVREVRDEVAQTRDAYKKFQGQTGNLLNGTLNGIAAGATSGIIAAVAAGGLLCVVM